MAHFLRFHQKLNVILYPNQKNELRISTYFSLLLLTILTINFLDLSHLQSNTSAFSKVINLVSNTRNYMERGFIINQAVDSQGGWSQHSLSLNDIIYGKEHGLSNAFNQQPRIWLYPLSDHANVIKCVDDRLQSCEIVDQAQTESDESDLWFNSTTVDWQAFVPNLDNIVAIAVQVERSGDPGNLILRLKETESGKILIEEIRPATEVPESGWLKIYLSSWVEIIPGDTYQILINSDQPESSEYHHYSWFGNQDSSYAPPSSRSVNPDMQDFDFTFITYGMAGCNFNYLPLIIKGFP